MGDGVRHAVSVGDCERYVVGSRLFVGVAGLSARTRCRITEVPLVRHNRPFRIRGTRSIEAAAKAGAGGGEGSRRRRVASTGRGVGKVEHRGDAAVMRGRTSL